MSEHIPYEHNYEHEIAELRDKIESRRETLEKDRGIEDERELVRDSLHEVTGQEAPTTATLNKPHTDEHTSYTDDLSEESKDKVGSLLNMLEEKGIKKSLEAAKNESPFILDAFHDVLVDKLYEDLKARGIVS